jgi:tetratricopeptide (TPR) repeat protein
MPRNLTIPLFALAALAAGCGRSDRPQTSSASAGATTPVVSGSSSGTTDSSGETTVEATPVTYARAESTYGAGRYPEAIQLFSRYTESNPDNPWGYYMLGLSAWRSGEHDRALDAFDRSLQLDPSHRKSLFNSSRVLLEMGRTQDALERIEKALAQEPMSNEGLRLLGRARYQLGKVDDAIEAYYRALVADDGDVWSMNNLGLIYIDQNRSSEALAPLARAVQLRSNAPVFQNNLGMALERAGYPEAAAKAFESAIEVDSTYKKASVALARVTSGGQQPEAEPIDLAVLAQQFQSEVEGRRGAESVDDSTTTVKEVSDSVGEDLQPLPDTSKIAVEASDTLEECEHGE